MAWKVCLASLVAAALALPTQSAAQTPSSPFERILATDDVRDCVLVPGGRIAAATAGGLAIIEPGGDGRVLTALDGLPDTLVERVWASADSVLAQTARGAVQLSLPSFRLSRVSKPPSERPRRPSQDTWVGMPEGAQIRAVAGVADRSCIATDRGLFLTDGRAARRLLPSQLPTGDVSALAVSAERLYVGTFDRGLYRVEPSGTVTLVRSPAINPNVNALAWDADQHLLWVGTARGLVRCDLGEPSRPACRRFGGRDNVHALVLVDHRVVSGGETGITFFDSTGQVEVIFGRKEGAPFRAVWALAIDRDRRLYVGTSSGLFWQSLDNWRSRALPGRRPNPLYRASLVSGELPDDWVTALAIDGDKLQVGTYNAGMVTLARAQAAVRVVASDASLGYVNPAGISVIAGGQLAVATMEGLQVGVPGDWRHVRALGSDVTVTAPAGNPTDASLFWVATRRGLMRTRLATAESRGNAR